MIAFPTSHLTTGLEISSERITAVKVAKHRNKYSVESTSGVKIPTDSFKVSFKHLNILDSALFSNHLKKTNLKKIKKANIALPDGCCKVFIRRYNELPDSDDTINDLITWDMANQLNIENLSELRCGWEHKGSTSEQEHLFIVVVMLEKVIEQYETLFSDLGISINTILPAGLCQYNFYSPEFSEMEDFAFLCLFDESISIYVFVKGIPVFYKTLRKGLIGANSPSAMNDLDLFLQYYHGEIPDLQLDRIVVASPIEPDYETTEFLVESFSAEVCHYIDERKLMNFSTLRGVDENVGSLSFFSAALGAAKGI